MALALFIASVGLSGTERVISNGGTFQGFEAGAFGHRKGDKQYLV